MDYAILLHSTLSAFLVQLKQNLSIVVLLKDPKEHYYSLLLVSTIRRGVLLIKYTTIVDPQLSVTGTMDGKS